MKVLKAIGGFFVKIGRWIRDTAWVQPLLIVGGIFALIFAIKPTVNWVGSWFVPGDEVETYYNSKKLSWSNASQEKSQVHDLLNYMKNPDSYEGSTKFADKFFVLFYEKGCSGCKANYDGFSYLESHMGYGEFSNEELAKKLDERDYKNGTTSVYNDALEASKTLTIYTIDCLEIDYDDEDEMSFFKKYIYGNSEKDNLPGYELFQTLVETEQFTTPYLEKQYNNVNETLAEKWAFAPESSDSFGFYTPTVLMFEKNYMGQDLETNVTEAIFDVEGENGASDGLNKARTLWDCWTHSGDFSRYQD